MWRPTKLESRPREGSSERFREGRNSRIIQILRLQRANLRCRELSESSRGRRPWPRTARDADWWAAGLDAARLGNLRQDRFLRSLVFVFVGGFAGDVFEQRIVVGWFADDVFFAGPVAEVVEFAAFAAERKFRVRVGVRRLLADGAAEFHVVKNTAKCGGVIAEKRARHSVPLHESNGNVPRKFAV